MDTINSGIFRHFCLRTNRFYKYKYSVFFTSKERKVNTSFSKNTALQMKMKTLFFPSKLNFCIAV